jgi:RHS repeat-associated protein
MGISRAFFLFRSILRFTFNAVILSSALTATMHAAQTNLAVTVRHAPSINGNGLIEGSLQQLLGENITLSGDFTLSGDLLLPGTPSLQIRGQPAFAGIIAGDGSAAPAGYRVTLNGDCSMQYLRTRTTPVTLPIVPAPPQPAGTRSVIITAPGQSIGDPETLRDLTLDGGPATIAVPPGTYGNFVARGGTGFTLGTAGATQPVIYHFQNLILSGDTRVDIVGPVIVIVANGFAAGGSFGARDSSNWLQLEIANGGFTLNGGGTVHGSVIAPAGTITVNGHSCIIGRVQCDRLVLNGGGCIKASNDASAQPTADARLLSTPEDTSIVSTLTGSSPQGAPLIFTVLTQPFHGTLSGTAPDLTYQPATNFNGTDSFTFKVNDGQADSAAATISITVTAVNDSPVAMPQAVSMPEGEPLDIELTGSDMENDPLTFEVMSGPSHGMLTSAASHLTYTPALNYNGPDSFTFRANDGHLDSVPATISITVLPVDDAPIAISQTLTLDEDSSTAVTLSGADVENDPLTFTVTQPAHGAWSGTPPDLIYTPATNYHGSDSLTFTVNDGFLDSAPATVAFIIRPVNDPPVAVSQTNLTLEDIATNITLTASDADGDAFSFAIASFPAHGTLHGTPPELTYSPAADFNGIDSFNFLVNDGQTNSAPATVYLIITPVNDRPEANAASLTNDEDVPITLTLTASDVDGDALTYSVASAPAHGTLSGATPALTYTPGTNYNGADSFTFVANDGQTNSVPATVSITINPVADEDAPVNQSPTVSAGPKQLVTLPADATLFGAVSDDGFPHRGSLSVAWSKVSGPGAVSFATPTATNTSASFANPGDYTLRLTANDTELTNSADVQVRVRTATMNAAPVVSAGADRVVGLTSFAVLDGAVSDDGLPQGAGLSVNWSRVSGPGAVTFDHGTLTSVRASFAAAGTYVLRLTASDSVLTDSDDVTITVYPFNQPPVVNAGPDQTITISDPAILLASGVMPTNASVDFSTALPEVAHWSNAIGQPGLTGAAVGPGTTEVGRHGLNIDHGTLVVSGAFTNAGGIIAKSLARFDGTNWYDFYDPNAAPDLCGQSGCSGGVVAWLIFDCGTSDFCNEVFDSATIRGQEVFASGHFKDLGNLDGKNDFTARWDGNRWRSWSFKIGESKMLNVHATPDKMYVFGNFSFQPTNAAAQNFTNLPWGYNVAMWDGTNWGSLSLGITDIRNLPTSVPGLSNNTVAYVTSMAVATNGNVYVAGQFLMPTVSGIASNVAMWNGTQWMPLGAGIRPTFTLGVHMTAMGLAENGDLYVGGTFSSAGGVSVRNIARWDGTRWWPVGDGPDNGVDSSVEALVVHGRDVYVGGAFTKAGGQIANHIARWDGQLWLPLGTGPGSSNGVNGTVFALAVDDTGVYIGGTFTQAGGQPASRIARWEFPRQPARGTQLSGHVTDDGLPSGAPLTSAWTKVSGPGEITFADSDSPITAAVFSKAGQYVLRLSASDSDLPGFDEVTINVQANAAPVVDAGPDHLIGLNEPLAINGLVSDDGLPQGAPVFHVWKVLFGPDSSQVTFDHPDRTNVIARFSVQGTYVLRLYANDSQFTASDDIAVVVRSPQNQPPSVFPGSPATILLGSTRQVNATVSDDGFPIGVTNVSWSVVSGPGIVTFDNANAINPVVSFSTNGVYTLQISANDSELSAVGNSQTTVDLPINTPPIVNAGPDQTISNLVTILQGIVSDDSLPAASALSIFWTRNGSAGVVTFANSNSPTTAVTFSQPGIYSLILSASDGVFTRNDTVFVTVANQPPMTNAPPPNSAPLVNAGPDLTIRVTNTISLNGTVTDDALPGSGKLTAFWNKISGPGLVTFGSPNNSTITAATNLSVPTSATFGLPGTYVLRLTADDAQVASSDTMTITVLPVDDNQAPTVNAGPDANAVAFALSQLNGTLSDDRLPAGSPLTVNWAVISGPGRVYFSDAHALKPIAQFSVIGTYVLRLTANDTHLTASDDVTIVVTAQTNEAPVVFAGLSVAVTRPEPAFLEGLVLDDSLPLGFPLTATWSKVSGPGTVTFSPSANDPLARATFSVAGDYVLRLTASDSQFSDSDDVLVTVFAGTNAPPSVSAGPDFLTVLSTPAELQTEVSDDGLDDGILEVTWSKVSGPGSVSFSTVQGIYRADFSAAGDYVLRLKADDGSLTNSDDVAVTVYDVLPPIAEIDLPLDGAIITSPTNIIGTASSDVLQSYVVEYRLKPADGSLSHPTGESQGEGWSVLVSNSVSVVTNILAQFDPTLLLNGIYELRLAVTDLIGRSVMTEPITVIVDRNLKIGQFTISFKDLAIPVAGMPLQIIRTYDSRAAAAGIPGDFGIGWTLDIRNVRLQKSRPLGRNWTQTTTGSAYDLSLVYHLDPVTARIVTITFPDGRVEKFQFNPNPFDQALFPIDYPQWRFTPIGNTRGTLVPAGYDDPDGQFLFFSGSIPGTADLVDLNFFFDALVSSMTDEELQEALERYPTLFRYTSPEGYQYLIDEIEGLQSVTDPNGNTLLIGTNGLTWTNVIAGTNSLSIGFQRDAQRRITKIVDAAGHAMTYRYDANGNLTTFIDRIGQTNGFRYTNAAFPHHLTGVVDARGITPVRNEYDARGRLFRNVDAFDGVIGYTHDLADNREYVTNRLGDVTISEYDHRGNVTRLVDPLGAVTLSSYDENGNLLAAVDPLGRTNRFRYDALDNRLTVTDPLGNTTTFTYGAFRRVTSVTDPRGNSITNLFDSRGNLLATRDPLGNITRFACNNQGLPTAMTNALGQTMTFDYDLLGRLIGESDALNHVTKYQRDANGNLRQQSTTRTTPAGLQTLKIQFFYDAQSRLTNSLFPDGSSASAIYNAIGKPAVTIDQLGRQTAMEYDALGRLTRTTFADDSNEASGYDAEGRQTSSTNRLGQVTRFEYDAIGRLFRTINADGASTTNYFDLAGQIVVSTDVCGNRTRYGYDAAGRSVAVTNALGQVNASFYDAGGNLTNAVDALGRSTRFSYDSLNRRTQTVFADGTLQTTAYDVLGHRTHEQDQAGKVTDFTYDALGRLTAVTNALGYVTSFAYDELGQQISQTDANNHTTTFEYDSLGRRVKRTLPGNQVETYAYNIGGLLTNRTDFNGYSTTYHYDLMNRVLAKVPDPRRGEPAVTFNYNVLGLRTNMTDGSGATTYLYDNRNRLVQKTRTWNVGQPSSLSISLNYAYDSNGNLTNILSSDPNGVDAEYEYDALNRLSAVNDAKVGRTVYSYDDVGNLQGYTYPNGVNSFYQYDSLNRLTNLASSKVLTPIAIYAYTVGASGNRLTAREQLVSSALNAHPSTTSRVYTYDDVYRLTAETINGATNSGLASYNYDPVGNRLGRSSTLASLLPQNFSYDANDRLNTDTYDANGNTLVGAGFGQLLADQYDFENRLIQRSAIANSQSTTINLAYDGDGNRVSKKVTTNGTTTVTYFVVDGLNPSGYAQVLEEHVSINDQPSVISRVFTYGHTLISQDRLESATWLSSFYGYDGRNNVRYLTDLNGGVTDAYDYDAFGNLIARTGNTLNNYLFTGEQSDSDLRLYYLRARYENQDTGRFWTEDLFDGFSADPASLHKYTYCGNNPINCHDPSGNATLAEVSVSTGMWAVARSIFGGIIGGLSGALAAGYDSILHNRVSNQDFAQAMAVGFREGATNGAFFGAVGGLGSIGNFGVSAIGLVYSGVGFIAAYQSYSSGNTSAGDFESALAAVGVLGSAPGVARGSVLGARGLTSALENYYEWQKNFVNIQRVPEALANAEHPNSPPYVGDAIEFETGRTEYFVRIIHIGNMENPAGSFLTTAESVIGKSRTQLKQMFALPGDVVGLQTVKVPPGIKMRAGRVAAQPNLGENNPGDALQYQLLNRNQLDNFSGNTIPVYP